MKWFLMTFLVGCSSALHAGETLEPVVVGQLKAVLENSQGVPQGMTAARLYEMLAEELDVNLNDQEVKALAAGKSITGKDECSALLKQLEALKGIKSPVNLDTLAQVLKDDSADARSREAAFRLLSHFNKMKVSGLWMLNLNRGKQLCLKVLMGEAKDGLKQPDELLFQSLEGRLPWLYKPQGFGDLSKLKDGGSKVILMAPQPVLGKLVVVCDNGSAHNLPVESLEGVLDLSQVKAEGGAEAEGGAGDEGGAGR